MIAERRESVFAVSKAKCEAYAKMRVPIGAVFHQDSVASFAEMNKSILMHMVKEELLLAFGRYDMDLGRWR